MEAKIRHLEMVRSAIDGASGNSLRIKGFAMLLLAGAIALVLRDGTDSTTGMIPLPIAVVLLVIVAILGLLDYHFTRQSDLFKILYNEAKTVSEGNVDFSMGTEKYGEQLGRRYKDYLPIPVIAAVILHVSIALVVILGILPPVWLII